jgi:hypothetical protein
MKKKKPAPSPSYPKLRPDQKLVPDVSLTHQKLVGRVVILFGKIEAAVQDAIWHILKIDEDDGRLLTAPHDFDDNLILLQALAKRHLTDERFASFLPTLKTIKKRQEDRNFVAHGTWGTLKPDNVPMALGIRKKAEPNTVTGETFPPSRMTEIANDLADAIDAIVALISELNASPDKQPRRPRPDSSSPDVDR